MTPDPTQRIAPDVKLGRDVKIYGFVNLYGCEIGDGTKIGTFVEIQRGARIGRACKIQSHTFICEGVTIEDECFIGHNVTFINDRSPRAAHPDGSPIVDGQWTLERTLVRRGATIGSSATILCGVTIGERAMVGAGSVVTRDVPPGAVVCGNPARAREARSPAAAAGATAPERIPLVDMNAIHAEMGREIEEATLRVLRSGRFIGGPEVEAFEHEWAAYAGTARCVACASGTDALRIGLQALGVGPGTEVVVPAMTFVASAMAATQLGARVALADVDEETGQVRPDAVRRAIGPRTRAIMAVHLYGHPAPVDELRALADEAGVPLVEDCAQAHGARWRGRKVGTLGRWAAWSFYPGKNLGACGDAGAITTDDPDLAARCARIRTYGETSRYVHEEMGWNSRLDALQAAILRAKIPHLDRWNEARRRLAARYREAIAGRALDVRLPAVAPGADPVWHLFVVRIPGGRAGRDAVLARLKAAGIEAGLHYPWAIHQHRAMKGALANDPDERHPGAEALAEAGISLPLYPQLSEAGLDRCVEALANALASS